MLLMMKWSRVLKKLAVIVPEPLTVAVVELDEALLTIIDPLVVHDEKT
jgi:hypothetical protein